MATRSTAEEWTHGVACVMAAGENEHVVGNLLDNLNAFVYPLDGLQDKNCERLLQYMCSTTHLTPMLITKYAQLCHSLVVLQKVPINASIATRLFLLFSSSLSSLPNPTEPLYAMSALTPLTALSTTAVEELLERSGPVVSVVISTNIPHQRAALNFISSLAQNLPQSSSLQMSSVMEVVVDALISSLSSSIASADDISETVLPTRLQLSLLRAVHDLLGHVTTLQPLPLLPSLLSALRTMYTVGLPGHQHAKTAPPIIPHPHKIIADVKYKTSSVAGPHQHRQRGRDRASGRQEYSGSEEEGGGGGRTGGRRKGREKRRNIKSTSTSHRSPATSDSDSDVSTGEEGMSSLLKLLQSKVRHQSLSCVSTILQSLDMHSTFSYGLPLLPDSPRGPSSPPTILTCIVKDPYHKCRRAAVSVLCSLLEGSKPFLAAANDRVCSARPFTPYSSSLGGVVSELHRCLLLAIAAEQHSQTLSLIIKCLSLLVVNSPYPQLSEPYLTRVCTAMEPLSANRDTTVAVSSLTCLGAVFSAHPPRGEVERWLSMRQPPWVMEHCLKLLRLHATPTPLQIESIQVLAALVKFYFHIIRPWWKNIGAVYISDMSKFSGDLQMHALKILEELGRSLSSLSSKEDLQSVVQWWEGLMSGPLTHWLQTSSSCPSCCAEATSVLSTIGGDTLAALKTPSKMLVLTLLLGLSKDQNPAVRAEAVRALGVFSKYTLLWTDSGFMADSTHCILEGLSRSVGVSVRVQAGWALGNIMESISKCPELSFLWEPLSGGVIRSMEDIDKVKVNGVRAAGYLLKGLNKESMPLCSTLSDVCHLLGRAVTSGQSMKTRWNACFACYNVFTNKLFIEHCHKEMKLLVDALCSAITSCKNFKVRTNAALALGTPQFVAADQQQQVWMTVIEGLEGSETQEDFAEYRQAQNLKEELCCTACRLIATISPEGLALISSSPPPSILCTNLRLFATALERSSSPPDDDASYRSRGYSRVQVVSKAIERLQEFVKEKGNSSPSKAGAEDGPSLFCNTLAKHLQTYGVDE